MSKPSSGSEIMAAFESALLELEGAFLEKRANLKSATLELADDYERARDALVRAWSRYDPEAGRAV